MGTFILFLLGYPGHTEVFISQARHLFQQLIRFTLVFLGLVTPAVQSTSTSTSPSARHHKAMLTSARPLARFSPAAEHPAGPPEMLYVPMNSIQHQWNYIFAGKATFHGQPCPNASILVRLIAGGQSATEGTITGPDGSYRLHVTINANEKDAVDWTVEAYTPEFNKVEISGRRIIQAPGTLDDQDKKPIVVNTPVKFIVSLAK